MSIADELGLSLKNHKDIQSRHSYNKYVFEYESLFSDIPLELIIETSFYQSVYPVEMHTVDCFVGKFCEKRGIEFPVPFEAATVYMNVQSLQRTFIDKVLPSVITDYRICRIEIQGICMILQRFSRKWNLLRNWMP